MDAIRYGSAGEASSIPRSLNPNTTRRIVWWKIFDWNTGAWADLQGSGGDARGPDLISAIVFQAAIEDEPDARERAARELELFLDRMPTSAPITRSEVGFRSAALDSRQPPARAAHRSLRRG